MTAIVKGTVIVGAKRTVFGAYGGKLKNISACNLQVLSNKAAMSEANLNPKIIDTVNISNVYTISRPDGILIARHAGLRSGVPVDKPALHINQLCGSGLQAVIIGVQNISNGSAKISLTGGTENMSDCPFILRNVKFGTNFGVHYEVEDSFWMSLNDTQPNVKMGIMAELLAEKDKLTRTEVDEYAYRSQMLFKNGVEKGRFLDEIVPVEVEGRNGIEIVRADEHPKPHTTIEGLQQLKPKFKENGVVTAGNASGISDGAATVIVASDEATEEFNLKPLARIHAYSIVGVDPRAAGIGAVPAIQNVLKITGLSLKDIDLIELTEAFAAQMIACIKLLKVDIDKVNVDGGAIALGHPISASGARNVVHLVYELRRRKGKYGIAATSIGGGSGNALLIESLN